MRIRLAKLLTLLIILLNVAAFFFVWVLITQRKNYRASLNFDVSPTAPPLRANDLIQRNVTVILRGFDHFENDIPNTIRSITTTYPAIHILILSDGPPYPPLIFNTSHSLFQNVRHVYLQPSLNTSFVSRTPLLQIKGSHVLFVPDSARIHTKKTLEKMLRVLESGGEEIVAASFKGGGRPVCCLKTRINVREWQVRFDESPDAVCQFVRGKHAALVRSEVLSRVADPFMLPFPDAFYLQTAARGLKIKIMKEFPFGNGKVLYSNPHSQWKVEQSMKEHYQTMYRRLGLKKVILETGAIEWYGCRRDTPRCFGTILDDTPQYIWDGKWTPPCCLAGLRRTARHVFHQLELSQARYWLEGGSLLGAVRIGDILPWDYDVDIGIYREDVDRVAWLARAKTEPTVDEHGFVWEKAVEGDFFRVHFSHVNRLHVDIFPFFPRNATMTKKTWFKTHRQDMEFPEHFLKPLSSIEFVGRTVSAPNNIHDFLELKFGEGAVENPVYPNPQKMSNFGLKIFPDKI